MAEHASPTPATCQKDPQVVKRKEAKRTWHGVMDIKVGVEVTGPQGNKEAEEETVSQSEQTRTSCSNKQSLNL